VVPYQVKHAALLKQSLANLEALDNLDDGQGNVCGFFVLHAQEQSCGHCKIAVNPKLHQPVEAALSADQGDRFVAHAASSGCRTSERNSTNVPTTAWNFMHKIDIGSHLPK
jgi:hypothetical protein